MLITFSGLDGCGKSTLVDHLKQSLEKQDRKVTVSHMNYDVGLYSTLRYLAKKALHKNGPSSHAPREHAYEGKFKSRSAKLRYLLVWNKPLRALIYPIDVLIFIAYRFYIERVNQHVLIMDRYFYDTLVDVTGASKSVRFRFLSWLTPTPTVPLYLDVTAERAFERKAEYSVDYLNGRRLSYQKLLAAVPEVLVLSTNYDLDTTRAHIESVVRERLAGIHSDIDRAALPRPLRKGFAFPDDTFTLRRRGSASPTEGSDS